MGLYTCRNTSGFSGLDSSSKTRFPAWNLRRALSTMTARECVKNEIFLTWFISNPSYVAPSIYTLCTGGHFEPDASLTESHPFVQVLPYFLMFKIFFNFSVCCFGWKEQKCTSNTATREKSIVHQSEGYKQPGTFLTCKDEHFSQHIKGWTYNNYNLGLCQQVHKCIYTSFYAHTHIP